MTDRRISRPALRRLAFVLLLVAAGAGLAARARGQAAPAAPAAQEPARDQRVAAACLSGAPYYALARQAVEVSSVAAGRVPAVTAMTGTGEAEDDQLTLASQRDVGTVYGLAYDGEARALFAASYHRRMSEHGPGGPGTIYRIDLASGEVRQHASLAAGPDRHAFGRGDDDEGASAYVGRTGLGDLELDPERGELLAVNLFDARIYRVDLASGAVLGSFAQGADGEDWRLDARPFGLGWRDGWLYHGVVDTGERGEAEPSVRLYRSRSDGAEMEEIAAFPLTYRRAQPWRAWDDPSIGQANGAQPMLVDVQPLPDGALALGLRDRGEDAMAPGTRRLFDEGSGDLLLLRPAGEGYVLDAGHLDDAWRRTQGGTIPDASTGSLAAFGLLGRLVTPKAADILFSAGRRLSWIDTETGLPLRDVDLLSEDPLGERTAGLGDVERLCRADGQDDDVLRPTLTAVALASQTASAATRTAGAPGTSTAAAATVSAAAPTRTAVAATRTALAPATATAAAASWTRIQQDCAAGRPWYAVTCFTPGVLPQALLEEPAIVAFDDTRPDDMAAHIPLAGQLDVGTVFGLAMDAERGQLYAGAYAKRGTPFGPGGPGAIYRVDLRDGSVTWWATLAAGEDGHAFDRSDYYNDPYGPGAVGRESLGDLELDPESQSLFAVNLLDRRIHRFSLPEGEPLGAFDHGAAGEAWAPAARPFGLAVWQGRLYHGVVDAREGRGYDATLTARVYSSRPDGSDMRLELDQPLSYERRPGEVPWRNWTDDRVPGQPELADIEFSAEGRMMLGLRDRALDGWVFFTRHGGILPAQRDGGVWRAMTSPLFGANRVPALLWGTLAAPPDRSAILSTAADHRQDHSGWALWFHPRSGALEAEEQIYDIAPVAGDEDSHIRDKLEGLGDMESLCRAPEATPTPTATPTPSASPTAPRVTPTPTAPPRTYRVYLPMAEREDFCIPRETRTAAVLVLDMSTSMYRTTRTGRTKHEAALEAASLFVDLMRFAPDRAGNRDQVGVVGFNDRAWTASALTSDPARAHAALDSLPDGIQQGTRLDLALAEGQRVLDDPRRLPGTEPVLILLTDGLPNRVPTPEGGGRQEDTVLRVARGLHAAGTNVFTVGLGRPEDLSLPLLEQVATVPANAYVAPDGEDLAAIYRRIAGRLTGCE